MKNLITILIFVLFVSQTILSQWYIQYTHSFPTEFYSVHFYDNNIGWTVGTATNVFKTSDGGLTWFEQVTGSNAAALTDICFIDNNIGWVVGMPGKIYKTTNGGSTWWNQSTSIEDTLPSLWNSVCFIDNMNGWIAGDYDTGTNWGGRIIHTSNGGTSWNIQFSDPYFELRSVYFKDSSNGWAVGKSGLVMKTTDGGNTWNMQNNPGIPYLESIIFIDNNTGWLVGWWGTIWKSTDGGYSWNPQTSGTSSNLYSVLFSDAFNGWAVGEGGTILNTTNGGIDWNVQLSGITGRLRSVFFTNSLIGWAAGEGGIILHTVNGGVPVELTSFTASVNKNNVTLNWKTATELNNKGFDIERSQKSNVKSQNEWVKIGYVPGSGTTSEPRFYSFADNDLEPGNYAYRLKQIDYDGTFEYSKDVEVEIGSPIPVEFSLEQNYPNPFNPVTTILYNLPDKNLVSLKVFNILGEEVKTLVKEIKEAGSHKVEFSAGALPSGIYFYRIKTGNFVETKKMLLLK